MRDVFSLGLRLHSPTFEPSKTRSLALTLVSTVLLGGCVSTLFPTLKEPDRLFDHQKEIEAITTQLSPIGWGMGQMTAADRNNYISLRMYAIDENYTIYESQLTHEAQSTGLAASLINLGLTGAGSVAPTAQVGKALSAAATGITGASQAYDKDLLLAQSIQNLQTQMRADRNAKAAIILTSMKCPVSSYNMGMVLSDLEEYYRAGTLPNAMITITKAVGQAETQAKSAKATANPAAAIRQTGADNVDQPSIDSQSISSNGGSNCIDLAQAIVENSGRTVPAKPPAAHLAAAPPLLFPCHVPSPLLASPTTCQAIKADFKQLRSAASQTEARQICRDISNLSINPGVVDVCALN